MRSFFDLAAEAEDGVLLEALADVQDVLVLECDEAHLLQPPLARLLYQTHHGLGQTETETETDEYNLGRK